MSKAKEAVYVDAQPDMGNCSHGLALQPNATADGVRRMKEPVVLSMTKYLFDHYRLTMFEYLDKSLRRGQLSRLVGFSFTNRKIDREVCTFRSVNCWRIDRLNFWADVHVSLFLSSQYGIREWRGYLCFWFTAEEPGPLVGTIEEMTSEDEAPNRGGMALWNEVSRWCRRGDWVRSHHRGDSGQHARHHGGLATDSFRR